MAATSELSVIVEVKRLCKYVLNATGKSPKKYRFTLVAKLQNNCLNCLEELLFSNAVFVTGDEDSSRYQQRIDHQRKAIVHLRALDFLANLAMEENCITFKQYEQISKGISVCGPMILAWIKSEKRRYEKE